MFKCEEMKCARNFKGVCGPYETRPIDDSGKCTGFLKLKDWKRYEFNVGDRARVRARGTNEGKVVEIIGKELQRQPDIYRYLVQFESFEVLDYYGDELEPATIKEV